MACVGRIDVVELGGQKSRKIVLIQAHAVLKLSEESDLGWDASRDGVRADEKISQVDELPNLCRDCPRYARIMSWVAGKANAQEFQG